MLFRVNIIHPFSWPINFVLFYPQNFHHALFSNIKLLFYVGENNSQHFQENFSVKMVIISNNGLMRNQEKESKATLEKLWSIHNNCSSILISSTDGTHTHIQPFLCLQMDGWRDEGAPTQADKTNVCRQSVVMPTSPGCHGVDTFMDEGKSSDDVLDVIFSVCDKDPCIPPYLISAES